MLKLLDERQRCEKKLDVQGKLNEATAALEDNSQYAEGLAQKLVQAEVRVKDLQPKLQQQVQLPVITSAFGGPIANVNRTTMRCTSAHASSALWLSL